MLAIFVVVCAIQTAAFGQSCNPTIAPSPGCVPLYEFQGGTDGDDLFGELTLAPNGALYGTTWEGGTYDMGTVFELTL